jgi:hypothetical protein
VVLVNGRLVAELTQAALRERLGNRGVIRLRLDRCPSRLLAEVREISPQAAWVHEELVAPASPVVRTAVLEIVRRSGANITGLIAEDGRLDDLYRELVGRDALGSNGNGCTEYSEDRT